MPLSTDTPFLLAGRMQHRKRRRRSQHVTAAPDNAASAPARQRSPAQRTGDRGEAQALAMLVAQGLQLLGRNLHCAMGEIDLVMRDGNVLVFVEVRARGSSRYGGAAASVGPAKQRRLRHAAHFFLPRLARQHWHGTEPACRFDVVALEPDEMVWLRGALENDE